MADPSSSDLETLPKFWRRTPPALFPAIFGLFGLGLLWRSAADTFPNFFSPVIGETLLTTVGLFYLFCVSCYISKVMYRPKVMFEDIQSPPGRAGAAALTLCVILLSVTLAPYDALIASVFLWVGLIAHVGMTISALLVMSQQERGLKVTPAWHLSFVGFILASVAAIQLGFMGLAVLVFVLTFVSAVVIYTVSALQFQNEDVPAPARPLLMVHLAPVSLFATVSAMLGLTAVSFGFVVLAVGFGAVLASRYAFLTEAGFSPLWGAFTFPVAALGIAIFVVSANAPALSWLGLVPLLIASIIVPVIAVRIVALWANGELAKRTGAALA